MDWQLPVVLVVVTAAACYLAARVWRGLRRKTGCGGSCGCAGKPRPPVTIVPVEQLTLRRP
jgi:hypothetical protein